MLPQHYHYNFHFAKQRENELIEQARITRLLTETKVEKPRIRARLFSKSGEILIFIGQKLKGQYEPEAHLAQQSPPSIRC